MVRRDHDPDFSSSQRLISFLSETGSHHVAQSGLKFTIAKAGLELSDLPASVSQVLELEACPIPNPLLLAGL